MSELHLHLGPNLDEDGRVAVAEPDLIAGKALIAPPPATARPVADLPAATESAGTAVAKNTSGQRALSGWAPRKGLSGQQRTHRSTYQGRECQQDHRTERGQQETHLVW